jgi:predicted transglutaminase-like cysteine proteinase
VNRRVRFTDDQRQFGRADVWSAANDTLQRGRGDCEDYAIAKLQMLRRAGISDRDLYLVIVRDLVRRADHAVLVVRAAGHMYVLDNGTDDILDSETVSDYRPVLTFAATGAWTHGYRVRSAPMVIASGEIDSTGPVIPAADGQRSRSASLLAFNTGFSR